MYEYTLKFCNTTANGNADTLSQLPLPVVPANVQDSPVTASQFCSWTERSNSIKGGTISTARLALSW